MAIPINPMGIFLPPFFSNVPLPSAIDQIPFSFGLNLVLPEVVNDNSLAQKLGFSSVADIALATVGDPLPLYVVRLDDLQNLSLTQADFLGLLMSQGNLVGPFFGLSVPLPARLLFPILVAGTTRSCIEVVFSPQKNQWRINAIGMSELCIKIQHYRTDPMGDMQFVLRVPALNRYYLGRFEPQPTEIFKFRALWNDSIGILILGGPSPSPIPIAAGDYILGSLLFSKLKDEANTVNPHLAR